MKNLSTGLITGLLVAFTVSGQAGAQTYDELTAIKARMNPLCSEEAKDIVAASVRQTIEDSVTRGEAAILPPSPLGDLACLQGLMNAPLDIFSGIGGIAGTLATDLMNQVSSMPDAIRSQICAYAAEQWSELTQPVYAGLSDASGALSFNASDIWSNLRNTSSSTGNGSTGSTTQNPSGIGDQWGVGNADSYDDTGTGEGEEEATLRDILDAINNLNGNNSGNDPRFPFLGGGDD